MLPVWQVGPGEPNWVGKKTKGGPVDDRSPHFVGSFDQLAETLSRMRRVTVYGSQFALGRRSSA